MEPTRHSATPEKVWGLHPPERALTKWERIWRTVVWLFSWLPCVSKPGPPPMRFVQQIVSDIAELQSTNLQSVQQPASKTMVSQMNAAEYRNITVTSTENGVHCDVKDFIPSDEGSKLDKTFEYDAPIHAFTVAGVGLANSPGIDPVVNRNKQEDRAFSFQVEWRGATFQLSGIADGHNGDKMANYVQRNLKDVFEKHLAKESSLSDQVVARAFQATAEELQDEAIKTQANFDADRNEYSGTTLTATLLTDDRVYSLNCGDSRTIAVGKHHHLQLTKDQDASDEVLFDRFIPPHPKSAKKKRNRQQGDLRVERKKGSDV